MSSPDIDTLQSELERDGFAVARSVLSPSEVDSVRMGFDRLLEIAKQLPTSGEEQGSHFVLDRDPFRLHRVVWCGAAAPRLALGDDPRFLELASTLLGSRHLVQIIQQAHFKLPGDTVSFAWHQDASNRRCGTPLWSDVNGRGSFLQIGLAVDPMTAENGPLRMIPGSHRRGFLAHPTTGELPEEAFDAETGVDLLLEPGDLALFGPYVIHGSLGNTSAHPRRLLLQGYALPGANRRIYPGCGVGIPRVHGRPLSDERA